MTAVWPTQTGLCKFGWVWSSLKNVGNCDYLLFFLCVLHFYQKRLHTWFLVFGMNFLKNIRLQFTRTYLSGIAVNYITSSRLQLRELHGKIVWELFLGKSHFSYIREGFRINFATISDCSILLFLYLFLFLLLLGDLHEPAAVLGRSHIGCIRSPWRIRFHAPVEKKVLDVNAALIWPQRPYHWTDNYYIASRYFRN